MKLKSGKSLSEFFSFSEKNIKIGIVIILGMALILIGSFGTEEKKTTVSEEDKIAEICSMMDGVGKCRAMITYRGSEKEKEVFAVLILCEGADSTSVRSELTEAICAIYGIGANRVEIFSLKE